MLREYFFVSGFELARTEFSVGKLRETNVFEGVFRVMLILSSPHVLEELRKILKICCTRSI